MLKFDDKTINKLALGDKIIHKAFLGDKLVFQTGAEGYFVEYIEFDGNSWIDTGIAHQNCRMVCDIIFENNGIRQLMGFDSSTAQYWGCATNGIFDGIGDTNATAGRAHVILDFVVNSSTSTSMTISGIGKTITWNGTRIARTTYTIGAIGNTSTKYAMYGKVWGNKTYIDGELVQDLRPYVTSGGVACFKDVVTGHLFMNAGTGTLTAGQSIEPQPMPTNWLDYIQSDGNQYIDAEVFADNTYTFDTRVAMTQEDYNCVFWGTRSSGSYSDANLQCYLNTNPTSYQGEIRCLSTSTNLETNWHSGVIPQIYQDYEFTGITVVPTMEKMRYSIILFGFMNAGTIALSYGKCRIYKFVAYSNGEVVRDLRPCLDPNGVVCMYDMVTRRYFYNKGTGEFLASKSDGFANFLYFDGNSYIDTGIVPEFGDELQIQYGFNGTGSMSPFGAGTEDYQLVTAVQGTATYYKYFETGGARSFSNPATKSMVLFKHCNDGSVIAEGIGLLSAKQGLTPQTVNTNLFIGTRGSLANRYKGQIGTCKLIGADGTVKIHLEPFVDDNGIACMYDMISEKCFYNQGTGNLTAG